MNMLSKPVLISLIVFYMPSTYAFDFLKTKSARDLVPKNSICTALGGTTTTCTLVDANIALQEAIATCDTSYEKYEKQVNKKGFWKSAIGIAGTFAGSVGVPISSGDVALGLGGFAGATNALQMDVQNMVSTTMNTAVLGNVYSVIENGMNDFNTESDANKKITIAMMMGAACKYSAGKTQAQVLTNIAGVVGANIESVPVNKMENKMRETSEEVKQLRNMIEQRLTRIEQGQGGVNNPPLVPQVPAPRPQYK